MTQDTPQETLPDEAGLALAYTPPALRDALKVLLEFDARLSRLVAATTEPMLGQMRLAWWRETLAQPTSARPQGDVVLDTLGREWEGYEAALTAIVDGWEHMLADPPLSKGSALSFGKGRASIFEALASKGELGGSHQASAKAIGTLWAIADAASHVCDEAERSMLVGLASELGERPRLPKPLRGLAVLGALAERSIKREARPMLEGRGAALVALRAGLAGR